MAHDRMTSAVEDTLLGLGLVLDDLTVTPAGRRRVVRVVVDRDLAQLSADDHTSPVAPLTLDEVATATRAVEETLDGRREGDGGEDLMGSAPYTLEVTSPGVDRPLSGVRAYRRNVGRLAAFVLETGDAFTARIVAVGGQPVVVSVDVPSTSKAPPARRDVPLDDVTSAVVQVEFGRPATAGSTTELTEELDEPDVLEDVEEDSDGY